MAHERTDSTRPGSPHGQANGSPQLVAGAHPVDYLKILYRRRWVALCVIGAVLAAAAARTFSAVPIYEAEAKILIASETPNVVAFQEVLEDGEARANYYQTQYELLRSRSLARRVVDALELWNHPEFAVASPVPAPAMAGTAAGIVDTAVHRKVSLAGEVPAPPETSKPDSTVPDPQNRVVDALLSRLRIAPTRGTQIVDVRFRSSDPKLAAAVANAHVRHFIDQHLELKFQVSKEATDWLSARLAEERERVRHSESALLAFREEHDALSLAEGQDIVVQKLTDLNAAVTRARMERIEREVRYRQLQAAESDPVAIGSLTWVLANPLIQQLKFELARIQGEHAQLAETLGERHPTLVEKRTAMKTAEERLAAETARVVRSIENDFHEAVAQENSLAGSLEAQKREALSLNRRGIEYGVLKREAESIRAVYNSLLQRAKETGVSGELRSSNVRVVDAAEPPRSPVFPRTGFNLLMALLGGSLLAVGFAFAAEYMDDRIKTPDDIIRRLDVRFLALIPEVASKGRGAAPTVDGRAPPSFLEAIRALRTSVMAACPGEGMRPIVIASASESEGKTTVACNLAIALAQVRQRVLLVDADMRRPGVHGMFGGALGPGLSNLLSEAASELDLVLRPTRVPGLQLITAGAAPDHAPDLLGSPRFTTLLQALLPRFDWVIFDSPPVLAVADAAVIARNAAGVILVIGADMTPRRAVELAIEQFEPPGGRLLGAILNRADLRRHAFYYSPYQRRDYGRPDAATGRPGMFDHFSSR